mgnify:CR=1 FL=1
MTDYRKLNNDEKSRRYFNVKARCGTAYQKENPRYYGTYMCDEWLEDKELFFKWLDENYYVVEGEQMDIDKDILQYGNKQYHPALCLIVPHSINTFFENIVSTYKKDDKIYAIPTRFKLPVVYGDKAVMDGIMEDLQPMVGRTQQPGFTVMMCSLET